METSSSKETGRVMLEVRHGATVNTDSPHDLCTKVGIAVQSSWRRDFPSLRMDSRNRAKWNVPDVTVNFEHISKFLMERRSFFQRAHRVFEKTLPRPEGRASICLMATKFSEEAK
jgi:hypothetical protein